MPSGCLPETVCGFQDASWAENWWEQSPVLKLDISLNALEEGANTWLAG